jgi:acylpyruvate hydrolase
MMIRNIWCVGRNYQDHAKELGNSIPTEPLFFLKAGSSASVFSNEIELPYWTNNVHHEVELALKFNSNLQIVEGAVALDLTERTLQEAAKKNGLPWTKAKSFDGACAVSAFFQIKNISEIKDLRLRLWVNDELKQDARTSQMIFSAERLVADVVEHFPVCGGDLLLTGTPAGVGPLNPGDRVKAEIEGMIVQSWVVKKTNPPVPKTT